MAKPKKFRASTRQLGALSRPERSHRVEKLRLGDINMLRRQANDGESLIQYELAAQKCSARIYKQQQEIKTLHKKLGLQMEKTGDD